MSSVGRSQRGQALALFTLALAAITLGAAVVVDGGYGFAQRRSAQNAADFAAMAGTRIVGISHTGTPVGTGTAANVENAVRAALTANDAALVSAQYVDEAGAVTGNVVGSTTIPSGSFGVEADCSRGAPPDVDVIAIEGRTITDIEVTCEIAELRRQPDGILRLKAHCASDTNSGSGTGFIYWIDEDTIILDYGFGPSIWHTCSRP